jgi:hypothetical protein
VFGHPLGAANHLQADPGKVFYVNLSGLWRHAF